MRLRQAGQVTPIRLVFRSKAVLQRASARSGIAGFSRSRIRSINTARGINKLLVSQAAAPCWLARGLSRAVISRTVSARLTRTSRLARFGFLAGLQLLLLPRRLLVTWFVSEQIVLQLMLLLSRVGSRWLRRMASWLTRMSWTTTGFGDWPLD